MMLQPGWLIKFIIIPVFTLLMAGCISPAQNNDGEKPVADTAAQQIHTIEIVQMKFNPAQLTVHAGDKIIFVNHDLVVHNVTTDSGMAWVPNLPAGEAAPIIATQSSGYYCSLHPVMKGQLIVQ